MAMRQYKITVNSASDGTATGFSQRIIGGTVHSISYVKAAADNYADTVDFVITKESTAEVLWSQENVTASATVYPRAATNANAAGMAAALYASDGTNVRDKVGIAVDRVKITLAQAGANKTGQFIVLVEV
jgi:hypothetical protein